MKSTAPKSSRPGLVCRRLHESVGFERQRGAGVGHEVEDGPDLVGEAGSARSSSRTRPGAVIRRPPARP